MSKLPEKVLELWPLRSTPPVLTTVNSKGIPNSVYVTNITLQDDEFIAIADGAFSKTRENILGGSPGSFLFLTENAAIQLKGTFTYHSEVEEMEKAKTWADFKFPVKAIVRFKAEEAYNGAEKLM